MTRASLLQFRFILALIIAITVHEFFHAFVANSLGDPTPALMGRLTLNPLAHLDPIGTIMLLVAGIGWGKPVSFNPLLLQNPIFGGGLIALAGPFANFLLALVFSFPLRYWRYASIAWQEKLSDFSEIMVQLNLRLMAFNLIPLPPLDGQKVLGLVLPNSLYNSLLQADGLFFIILLLLVFSPMLFQKDLLWEHFINPIVNFFSRKVLRLP